MTPRTPMAHTTVGTFRGTGGDRSDRWAGIRYARPPVGELRWRRAQPLEPGESDAAGATEVIAAESFGPVCPQERNPAIPLGADAVMDEDCLYLNIWAPAGAAAAADDKSPSPRPVMVWLHGGAYVLGSGSQPLYDGTELAAGGDVLVVTLNYRLGVFGFADLSGIDERFETNLALSDVLVALDWVARHIAAFGGDPDNVTVFGESAGGGLVTALLTMPAAAGLFHRVIAQSAPVTSMYGRSRARGVAERIVELADLEDGEVAAGLLALDADRLNAITTRLFEEVPTNAPGTIAFAPVVDGDLLPEAPLDAARQGRSLPVPLIIGTNKDEANLFKWMKSPLVPITPADIERMFAGIAAEHPDITLPDRAQVLSAYSGIRPKVAGLGVARDVAFRMPTLWFADAHAEQAPVYLYRFDWATRMLRLLRLGAAHATELPYVWGNLGTGGKDITFLLGGRRVGESVAERMSARWTAFAHGRAPDAGAHDADWPVYGADHGVLVIGESDRVVEDLDADIRGAWGDDVLAFR